MKKLTYLIRDYFGFSQIEIRGFIVLIILMLTFLVFPLLLKFIFTTSNYSDEQYQKDLALLNQSIASLEKKQEENDLIQEAEKEEYKSTFIENLTEGSIKPFTFDPNTINIEQWKSLGLKPYLAQRIVKYRTKGGKFLIKSDLQKIYGFPEDIYQRLYPFIQLPENKEDIAKNRNTKKEENFKQENDNQDNNAEEKIQKIEGERSNSFKKKTLEAFDLNTADTAQLKQVRGIGAVLSERIVKFRNSLGGFHSVEQLKDVYGIKEEVYLELEKYAKLSKGFDIQKVNINTADVNTLKVHPYIGYKSASIIVNYRSQHGKFQKAEDLLKIKVLDESQINKLKPYLDF
jgi:competence protein ComEA